MYFLRLFVLYSAVLCFARPAQAADAPAEIVSIQIRPSAVDRSAPLFVLQIRNAGGLIPGPLAVRITRPDGSTETRLAGRGIAAGRQFEYVYRDEQLPLTLEPAAVYRFQLLLPTGPSPDVHEVRLGPPAEASTASLDEVIKNVQRARAANRIRSRSNARLVREVTAFRAQAERLCQPPPSNFIVLAEDEADRNHRCQTLRELLSAFFND